MWQAASKDSLALSFLHDLTAVYDRMTGRTHLLAPESLAILEHAQAMPGTSETILASLSAEFALASDEDPLAIIEARLHELESRGLVSRA
jgi:PqqD family protein of HPr-rel-A system